MPTLLQRLKERKIVQWAVVYLAGAWLFLEALGFVADNFGWPTYITRSAIVLAAVGFFAALVLAWYHGEKGRQRASGVELLILAGILVIAGAAVAAFGRGKSGEELPPATEADAPIPVDANSVAVLPFANMSAEESNEYFSDGITDDIITRLTKIADLKVISRQSSMQYKGSEKSLREIGQELKVATILQGGVRRAGDRIRVNAQLVETSRDENLWAEQYNRELKDVFAIQSEIAEEIAEALQATLTPAVRERIERAPTTNLEAYDAYLLGRQQLALRKREAVERAVQYFETAIELDSTFALAYSGLADAQSYLVWQRVLRPSEAQTRAKAAALRALEIDSLLGEAYISLATIELEYEWDWANGDSLHRRGLELSPQYAEGHYGYGWLLTVTGQFEKAVEEFGRAHALNPLHARYYSAMGMPLYYSGDYERALEHCLAAQEAYPDFKLTGCAGAYLALGMYEKAIAEGLSEHGQGEAYGPTHGPTYLGVAYALSGREDQAREVLRQMHARSNEEHVFQFGFAEVHVALGEADSALYWLEKSYEAREPAMILLRNYSLMEPLRSDPRYQDLLRRMNFPE